MRSILAGSRLPGRLVVWLAREELRGPLPARLRALERRGVEIRIIDRNFRPANKLVHALEAFPQARIITIDDDIVYPRRTVARLVRASDDDPGTICAHRAVAVVRGMDGQLVPFERAVRIGLRGRSMSAFPEGWHGVLYPPGVLHSDVSDLGAYRELASTTDDLWFGAQAARVGTPLTLVPTEGDRFRVVPRSQASSLWSDNRRLRRNDQNLAALMRAYPELRSWPSNSAVQPDS